VPCDVRCAKPYPEVFAITEKQLRGISPEQILFLDDQEQHCAAARRAGWNAIQVDSSEQMIREASQMLGLD
jgi:HAD superfamily hydrolase (TIGR01509 family)